MRDLETRLQKLRIEFTKIYEERTKKSRELFLQARKVLPGGVTYHIRFFDPYPLYIVKGKGSKVWDVDGNEYDDYWMGHGAHILGHAPDFVIEEVFNVAKHGTHLGYPNPYMLEYAELLTKIVPNAEMVRFTNSGTEANMYVVRLVRAFTGRRYIVKMEGGWHGGYDSLHVGVSPPFEGPESKGLPEEFVKYTIVVPFNDLDSLERALKTYPVAAVIMEPVMGAAGCIPPENGYLKEVRRLVDEHGALLVFDEVITGFRLALGGAQEFFGVKADIVVLGKIVGGGFPGAGAFAGRAEVMELLDHIKIPNPRERSFHGGTFTGNPVTIVAGYTLINYLYKNRHLYVSFNEAWSRFREELDKLCEEYGRICWVTGVGSMVGIHFTTVRPRNAREAYCYRISEDLYKLLHLYMRIHGVLYMTEHSPHLMPSMVHTDDQRRRFIELFAQFLEYIKGGTVS